MRKEKAKHKMTIIILSKKIISSDELSFSNLLSLNIRNRRKYIIIESRKKIG
jgi:hypothetical protein